MSHPESNDTSISPALSVSSPTERTTNVDTTLPNAINHLLDHLCISLHTQYPSTTIVALRNILTTTFTSLWSSTWIESHPQLGSGYRSLICTRQHGLPLILRRAAESAGINVQTWKDGLGSRKVDVDGLVGVIIEDEWEVWCDPGTLVWRFGGWEWDDVGHEPFKVVREPYQVIWQAAAEKPVVKIPVVAASTTSTVINRTSRAIPIRAPVLHAIPPTPADTTNITMIDQPSLHSPTLLPAVDIGHSRSSSADNSLRTPSPSPSEGSNRSISSGFDFGIDRNHSRASTVPTFSHRGSGSGSTSSNTSKSSDGQSGMVHLLTPGPHSAMNLERQPEDETTSKGAILNPTPIALPLRGRTPSPATPGDSETLTPGTIISSTPALNNPTTSQTPLITPYDGGNVTVLGGGVKLGGGGGHGSSTTSRAPSIMSTSRNPIDRSQSPSISLASRALTSALDPYSSNGRKQRTRKRIMPTYLGYLGQPGVGGPVMGAFGAGLNNYVIGGGGGGAFGGVGYGGQPGGMGGGGGARDMRAGVGVGMAPPGLGRVEGNGMGRGLT